MNNDSSLWLSRQVSENPAYRIICFPHAGGTASFFRNWGKSLPTFEVYSVCYPGRAGRIEEPQPIDIRKVAQEVAKAVEPLKALPLILFGHSMGAAVALETARALETKGVEVAHLFASGSRNGLLPKKEIYIEEDDTSLCKHLVEMGGTDSEAVNDPMFLELVLPSIRADGKMFNEYDMRLEPNLRCSVTIIYGDVDNHADIRPWKTITSGILNEKCVPGGHFYLITDPPYKLIMNVTEAIINSKIKVA